jgi:hypothetical protein
MIAAVHLDNFLFLLFVAVAIFFQLLTRAATKTGRRPGGDSKRRSTTPPQTPRPTTRQAETDEDRIRKFLEALGQPTTSKPPPPVAPRPTYQEPIVLPRVEPRLVKRSILSPLPPLKTRPPEVPAFEVHEGPPPLAPITEAEVAPAFQPTSSQPISEPTGAKINIVSMLKTTSGLRDAVILREIFGPPRSLQPLELVGNV